MNDQRNQLALLLDAAPDAMSIATFYPSGNVLPVPVANGVSNNRSDTVNLFAQLES